MKKIFHPILIIVGVAISSVATAEQRSVSYQDKVNKQTYKVNYDCDFSIPRAYACKKQEVRTPEGMVYVSKKMPKESDGSYKYWLSGLGYVATANQDIYTFIEYTDQSGSPTIAEVRYELVDFNGVSKYGLMTRTQFQQALKKIGVQMKEVFVGGLD